MLLTELFAAAVARHPERIAIDVPPNGTRPRQLVDYRELQRMAFAIADELAARVHGECTVLVMLPRDSAWLYAAQLGVLFAGAAHVCVDPSFPDAHVRHLARDAKAVAVVTDAAGLRRCDGLDVPVVVAPLSARAHAADRALPARAWVTPQSLAYVIYTSGTTGLPKGVLIEHAGVVNLVRSGVERFGLRPGDRIAQGSSAAYDSSVEETWLALASGATVVPLDDETVRLGPDLAAWLRRECITVFCPPPTLLRAMAVKSPACELPSLRLCYVGGEALPQDLADLWGAELWLENGYGPTECTVTVVRTRVLPKAPVAIGAPVPPHVAWILDENLQPVAGDAAGELCIAGPGLARGYLGQAELTAQRFPTLPGIGRVYRTGDLVTRGADGLLRCHGRIDAQVKVRGYRIELEAIEAALANCPGVREVACCAQDEGDERVLAAHVVPLPGVPAPDFGVCAAMLRATLPEYMVPARFGTLAELPRSVGGKVDRKRLPRLAASAPATSVWEPSDARERLLRDEFATVLHVAPAAIGRDADFFALGGDSLRAAMLVSRLRRQPGCETIAVRDVYMARTPHALCACIASGTRAAAGGPVGSRGRRGAGAVVPVPPMPWAATAVQVAFLLVLLALASGAAWLGTMVMLPWVLHTFSLTQLLFVGPWLAACVYGAYAIAAIAVAVGGKWLLIGRYRPGRYPVWGSVHVRHWLVVRLVRLVPWRLLEGSAAHCTVLRWLGARIGDRVHIHRGVDLTGGGFDLLDIGDDATLARETQLGLCDLDDGHLVVGAVSVGAGATLMTRASVGTDTVLGDGAVVGALSFVADGTRVPANEEWRGVPAARVGPAPAPAPLDVTSCELSPGAYSTLMLAFRALRTPLAALPFTGCVWLAAAWLGLDAQALAQWLCVDGPWSRPQWVWLAVVFAVVALPASLLLQALALRVTAKVPLGTHARWSWTHLRLDARTERLEHAGGWLAGTLLWPLWLRLAGMQVGRDVEISSIFDVLPEHTGLGGGSFLADGIYLGVPRHHQGRVTVARTELGERSFVGNHVVVDAGQRLPPELVLGVSTIADDERMTRATGWFGQPAFQLPRREVAVMERGLTHAPGVLRRANRVFWEVLRFAVPVLPVLLVATWLDVVATATGIWVGIGLATLATLARAGVLCAVVLALKWALLGRVQPGQHGLWSSWANRWDFHYVVWERYARCTLQPLEGTLLLPWFLRAIGMRIGKRCVLGDGFAQVVDPDMITIGDGATVHAMFQAHSFEDRVLKLDRVHVAAGASLGRGTVVLYGADIREAAHVMPNSVVMKHELLLAGRCYAGAPTVEIAAVRAILSA